MYHPKNVLDYQSNINHLAEPEFGRTKKIHVWEYGDSYNKDYEVYINPNSLRTWNSILRHLTDVINPHFGAVRKVVSLVRRKTVGCFEELEHNGKYIAIGAITRIKVQPDSYKTVSELNLITKSKKMKKLYSGEIGPPEFKHLLEATKRRLTIIFILVNGRPYQMPTKLVLTKQDLGSWDVILEYLAKVMDVPDGIQYVCTVFGEILLSPDHLQHGYIYVAVPFNEKFVKMDYISLFSKKKGYILKIRPASGKGSRMMKHQGGKSSQKELEALFTSNLDADKVEEIMERSISSDNAITDCKRSIEDKVSSQMQYKINYTEDADDTEENINGITEEVKEGSELNSGSILNELLNRIVINDADPNGYFDEIKQDLTQRFQNEISAKYFTHRTSGSCASQKGVNSIGSDHPSFKKQSVDEVDRTECVNVEESKDSCSCDGCECILKVYHDELAIQEAYEKESLAAVKNVTSHKRSIEEDSNKSRTTKRTTSEEIAKVGENVTEASQGTGTTTQNENVLSEERICADLKENLRRLIDTIGCDVDEKSVQTDESTPTGINNINDVFSKAVEDSNKEERDKQSTDYADEVQSISGKRKTTENSKENIKSNGKKPITRLNKIKKDGGISAALSENNLCSKNKNVPSIHIRNRTDINFCGFSKTKKSIICQDNKNSAYKKLYLNKSFSSPDRTSSSSEGEVVRVNKGNKCCFCIHGNKSTKMNKICEDEEASSRCTKTECMDTEIIVGFMESDPGEATEDITKEIRPSGSGISIDSIEADGNNTVDNVNCTQSKASEAKEDPYEDISCGCSTISADSIDGEWID